MPRVQSTMVEVCVFHLRGERWETLLLKRSLHDAIYPGLWQMVTGTIHAGETALAGARRELHEETGLLPVRFWIAPFTSSFYDPVKDDLNLIPFFAALVEPAAEPVLSAEHEDFAWLSFDEAERKLVWPGQRGGLDIVRRYIVSGEEAGILGEVL